MRAAHTEPEVAEAEASMAQVLSLGLVEAEVPAPAAEDKYAAFDAAFGDGSPTRVSGDLFAKEGSQETLFISAALESGEYLPDEHGITAEMFVILDKVDTFCRQYQASAGCAPTIEHVSRRYPSFEYLAHTNLRWATEELKAEHTNRVMRLEAGIAARALGEYDNKAAAEAFARGIEAYNASQPQEFATMDDFIKQSIDIVGAEVPAGTQQRILGDHKPGHVWTIAARSNVGKTWELVRHVVHAMESGWDVDFYSMEMSEHEVLDRVYRTALRDWKVDWAGVDQATMARKYGEWLERYEPGQLRIFDKGRVTPARALSIAKEGTLLVFDYVGLMYADDGQAAAAGYGVIEQIMGSLKTGAKDKGVPVLLAAQINRGGVSGLPRLDHISGADAIAHASDVVIVMADHSPRSRAYGIPKNRHGRRDIEWWTRFEPELGHFEDISRAQAEEISFAATYDGG